MEPTNALAGLLNAINFSDLIAIMVGVGTAGISFILAGGLYFRNGKLVR